MNILLTTTSFQDTPGRHQELLIETGFHIDRTRGPRKEADLLPIIAGYDGLLCGDDEVTRQVLKKGASGRLKAISKYGVGLDKIDLAAAEEYGLPITNCTGVNHTAVAEHFFALLLAFYTNICLEYNLIKNNSWTRLSGHEVAGKSLGIVGLGRIGKEIAKRAKAFGLRIYAFDKLFDEAFLDENDIVKCNSLPELSAKADIISLNCPLTDETRNLISMDVMTKYFRRGALLVNTSRAGLVDLNAVLFGLDERILSGYLTDVLEEEPMAPHHPLSKYDNVIITPHIGSRTFESVERQGLMAVENLIKSLRNSERRASHE
jgi:D-3-phosphoglycerate dehydrogenase